MEALSKGELVRRLEQKEKEIQQLKEQVKDLKQKVDLLVKKIFGKSSEKLERKLEEKKPMGKVGASWKEEAEDHEQRGKSKRKEAKLENLPILEEVVDPEEVLREPEAWRCIGEEVSEQLDYKPGYFFMRRLIRRKYVSRRDPDGVPMIAPLAQMLQERCIAATGLLEKVIVRKYGDHIPLYRQQQIFESRHKVWVSRQTMTRWIAMAADWLNLIYEEIQSKVMAGGYVQVDETPIRYLEPYVRDVLKRLPTMTNRQIKEMTPEALARLHQRQPLELAA